MNERNSMEADNDVYYDHLSDIYLSSLLSDFDKRKRTDMRKSKRNLCQGLLTVGPFVKIICDSERNLTG